MKIISLKPSKCQVKEGDIELRKRKTSKKRLFYLIILAKRNLYLKSKSLISHFEIHL